MAKFIRFQNLTTSLAIIVILFSFCKTSQSQNLEEGEKLYQANCVACHQIDNKLIGPALRGVNDKYSEEWLISWIKNSAEMIASGDPDAIAIYEEYNKSPMTAFPYFSDDDVRNILAYIEQAPQKAPPVAITTTDGTTLEATNTKTKDYIILTISIVL